VITVVGLQTGSLLGGAVIVETIFAWPGLGRLIVNAVYGRDFPLIQAAVLMMVVIFIVINITLDILYVLVDPRIKYG